MYTSIPAAEAGQEALEGAFEVLAWGVLVVDARARVLRANRAACELLDRREGLLLEPSGVLSAGRRDEDRRLKDRIREVAENAERDAAERTTLVVSREAGAPPLGVTVAAIRRRPGAGDPDRVATALVFVLDPRSHTLAPTPFLQAAFGLTAAEARIAARLADGLTSWEIAGELDLSIATVRTHVKHVLAKTASRRQSELIRLLLQTHPPLRPDDRR